MNGQEVILRAVVDEITERVARLQEERFEALNDQIKDMLANSAATPTNMALSAETASNFSAALLPLVKAISSLVDVHNNYINTMRDLVEILARQAALKVEVQLPPRRPLQLTRHNGVATISEV